MQNYYVAIVIHYVSQIQHGINGAQIHFIKKDEFFNHV